MGKTIGFNASERMRILAGVLARRRHFKNTSDMLRDMLTKAIDAEIPRDEQEQAVRLMGLDDGQGQVQSPQHRRANNLGASDDPAEESDAERAMRYTRVR